MHQFRVLPIRNPGRPTLERLPCKLTRDEKLAAMDRRLAAERTAEEVEAEILAIKAKAKADANARAERLASLRDEMRTLRNQILAGTEDRLVECELLEDREAGLIYVYRLDTREVAVARDMAPHERQQPELDLEGRETREVGIPDSVTLVRRFDSDTPDVGTEEADGDQDEDGDEDEPGDEQHECTWNEGACVVCGAEEPATKPRRRKRKGFDDRGAGAEAH